MSSSTELCYSRSLIEKAYFDVCANLVAGVLRLLGEQLVAGKDVSVSLQCKHKCQKNSFPICDQEAEAHQEKNARLLVAVLDVRDVNAEKNNN